MPGQSETFFTPNIDHYYTYTIPVTLSTSVFLNASVDFSDGRAIASPAHGESATAQGRVDLSASAWAVFTPTIAPIDGDFDGDGDVDLDDYQVFVQGYGEKDGATLSQGDANHDGRVDAADYTIWRDNWNNITSQTVPEPNSLSLIFFTTLLITKRR